MRSRYAAVWLALAVMALAPRLAAADEVQEQLEQMQERLGQLEDRLQATSDQLEVANQRVEQQQELIERAQLAEGTGSSSGLASFLETLEIGGWVSASYFYNFNDPDGGSLNGANAGRGGFQYPFHPDANSFSMDQLWFELERPVNEEHRAGFRADIVFGKTADILEDFEQDEAVSPASLSGMDDDLDIYQAYVQYLAPIGNGITFKAGKFATLFGAEVAQTVDNWNITRGHLYNLFQPITHVGVLASTERAGWSTSLGVVNSNVAATDIDFNNNKSVLWQLGYGTDLWSGAFTGIWGSTDSFGTPTGPPDESNKELILGVLLGWDPTERFSSWLNANYRQVEDAFVGSSGSLRDGDGWGVAVAGRYALTERLGLALRGEWIEDSDNVFAGLGAAGDESELYSITGTLDYSLTDQLLVRAELRWDAADVEDSLAGFGVDPDEVFISDGSNNAVPTFEDDQLVAGVEVVYSF